MKKIITFLFLLLSLSSFSVALPQKAFADDKPLTCSVLPQDICDKALQAKATNANPIAGLKPVIDWIANVIVGIFGAVAVLILIASGVQISASAGNENVVKQAKENIYKVITAVVLLISFRAILELVQRLFTGVDTIKIFNSDGSLASGSIPAILANVTSLASFAAGVVSVIFIIIGGIRYSTSGGNANALTEAKKTITYAIAGLVISISAYGILAFIQQQLQR